MKRSPVLEPLSHDHYEGLQLVARLRRAKRAGDAAAPWAEAVGAFWRDHLVPHFADEEDVVLPLLRDAATPLADRMRDEHRAIRSLASRIEAGPAGWEGPLGTFADALAAHIRFEEREAFPAAERLTSAEALARAGEQLQGRPSPDRPADAAPLMIVNPNPVALVSSRPRSSSECPPLTLAPDEMRRLGYRVIDMLVDHAETLSDAPVSDVVGRAEAEAALWEPPPERGASPDAVLDQLHRDVLGHLSNVDHPRFFAFIPSPSNFVSVLGDALASGFNPFAGTWMMSSGPATIELLTIDWLRQLCGLPEGAGGLFTSGGSAANLMALATARHVRLDDQMEGAVVYTSDQTHSSVARAMRVLGFRPGQLRTIPSDADYRLDLALLREAVAEDRAAGRTPFCVVANAGTTNTGAVDPLEPLADFCECNALWLHVDGAYGAAAVLSERGRARVRGIERADSLTLDPHKWFFQPYEIGALIVRDRHWLHHAFRTGGEYLVDAHRPDEEEVNFGAYGTQLTRSFRALKLWLSMKVFGVEAFREAVEHGFDLSELAERTLGAMPGWEVVTPARLGIVTFRYAPAAVAEPERNALNRRLVVRLREDGLAMVSSTEVHGRVVLRLCPINPRTTEGDIHATLAALDAFARDGASG